MVALFPTRQIGVEMGAIVLIFTGQVWNMAFSFRLPSIKSIPREPFEAASIYKFSRLQRLVQLELPLLCDRPCVEFDGIGRGCAGSFLMAC